MKIKLLEITPNAEDLIEKAARICYQSEPKEDYIPGSLIQNLIKRGHTSVLEHAYATFEIEGCSRSMTHQLVRHRLMAFSQQSQRYVNEKQFDYVIPPSIEKMEAQIRNQYHLQMAQIQEMYNYWKEIGIKNEDARFVLPNACQSEIVVSANFREFRHVFEVRCEKNAQWEIRNVAKEMLRLLYNECPNVFEDIFKKNEDNKNELV